MSDHVDLEKLILGGCYNFPSNLEKSIGVIAPGSFFNKNARELYKKFLELQEKNIELTMDKVLGVCTPELKSYFLSIVNKSFSPSEAKYYFDILLQKNKESVFMRILDRCVDKCKKNQPVEEVITELELAVVSFLEDQEESMTHHLKDLADKSIEDIESAMQARADGRPIFNGVSSGYKDLDKIISGYGNSHFIMIGARTGVGKTLFILNSLYNKLITDNEPVLCISLEMNAKELSNRLIGMKSGISPQLFRDGSLESLLFQDVLAAAKYLKKLNCFICDRPGMSFDYLRRYCMMMKKRHGIKAIYVDYLQLLKGIKSYENRQTEMADISKNFKALAKELDIPIICLGQLNREVEKRSHNAPVISDLRESGQIEQDADVIVLLHRPELYDQMDKPGLVVVKVAKNRHGKTGEFNLVFDKTSLQLKDYVGFEDAKEGNSPSSYPQRKDWD